MQMCVERLTADRQFPKPKIRSCRARGHGGTSSQYVWPVCFYVYMYVYVFVFMSLYYVHVHVCESVYVNACVNVYVCVHVYDHAIVYVFMCKNIYTYVLVL